jgi:hypothetical protein
LSRFSTTRGTGLPYFSIDVSMPMRRSILGDSRQSTLFRNRLALFSGQAFAARLPTELPRFAETHRFAFHF